MNASVIVCDDIRIEITGKLVLVGVYPGNLSIPQDNMQIPQLQFFFSADFPLDDVPKRLSFEVTLPGQETQKSEMDLAAPIAEPHHTRWQIRHVLGIAGPVLKTGKVDIRVVADGNECPISSPWVVLAPAAEPTIEASSNASPQPSEQSPTVRKRTRKLL